MKKNKSQFFDYNSLFNDISDVDNAASKILKGLLKANHKSFFISTILFLVKNAAVYVLPVVTAKIINIAGHPESHSLKELYIYGIIIIVLILQNLYTHVVYVRYTSSMLRSIGAGFRNSMVIKLQQLSLTFHKELESGRLQSKFIRDIESIETFLNNIMMSLVPAVITVIVTAAITISKSLIVSAFFIVTIPINVAVMRLFRTKMRSYNRNFRTTVEDTSSKISTMIEMIPVTKAHGLEQTEINKLQKNIERLKLAGMELDHVSAQFGSASWVAGTMLSCVCLIFTGTLAYKGIIDVGDVVLYQSYFNTISGNVMSLLNMYTEFAKGAESIKSVSEIIVSDRIEDNRDKIKLRYVHGSVSFKHVYYKYPGSSEYSIEDFNLTVNPGECIAFVGSSGSGKTTVMNMVIGFLMADRGEVDIDGKPINYLNLTDYRHFISVVPQNCVLFTGTIRENITYGLHNVSDEQLNRVIKLAHIDEFINDLPNGLDTVVEEHGGNLSGGQKQRISIARALIRDPKIIILDEATSALDNVSEYYIQQAMSTLVKDRTTFIVAHRLSTIRSADKIAVMEKGRCVEFGTYDELMEKKGKFYNLKTLSDVNK